MDSLRLHFRDYRRDRRLFGTRVSVNAKKSRRAHQIDFARQSYQSATTRKEQGCP